MRERIKRLWCGMSGVFARDQRAPESGNKKLPGPLKVYENADFTMQLKARFMYYLSVTSIGIVTFITSYSYFIQLTGEGYGGLNYPVLLSETVGIAIFLGCLILLKKGYYALASHFLLSAALILIWIVMIVDRGDAVSRLDSLVMIVPILSMIPLVVSRYKQVILLYVAANIIMLFLFMKLFRYQLAIPDFAVADYLADMSMALIFIGISVYNIFRINKASLERAEADIEERRKAEDALSFQKSLLEAQSEASSDGILVVDGEGRMISWNSRFRELWGIPNHILASGSDQSALRYIMEKLRDSDAFICRVQYLYEHPEEKSSDEIFLADGRIFDRYSSPVRGKDGQYLGRVWYFRDITGKKEAEDENNRLIEQLAQSQRMESIGRLAGGIAHDFNNLLTAISGNVDLSLIDLKKGRSPENHLTDAKSAAVSAATLTRQLLAFSRKQIIEPRVMDLVKMVSRSKNMLERIIGENIQLLIESKSHRAMIKSDPGQIEQIIVNLAVNARDAMPQGGTLTIETGEVILGDDYVRQHPYTISGRYITLSVSDTGIGIPGEIREHLFEPFFTTKPKGKGTGLGLATTYGAVKQNGGFIEVDSEPGQGSVFIIYLPRVESEEEDEGKSQPPDNPPVGGNETILLVEDDDMVRNFATNILERLGYNIISCNTAESALEKSREYSGNIHILVTDVVLPGMNGKTLADAIVKQRQGIKVLFTSGYNENIIVHHGVLDEGIQFIGKPYTMDSLARKIREIMDGV
ncbi:MAG: hypothetical protein CVV44_13115 [Spirochaetae bacterium HGW-Spirochaetae-1]|jgi:PAS domain S-box-containing protein|nr:MAG: hypothetical protein CVV44_13115 [Spirochaetae bacterium HGW-Spirochaetae-1]